MSDQGSANIIGRKCCAFVNAGLIAGILGIFLLASLADVTTEGIRLGNNSVPQVCAYKRVFGHTCPGCGLTRSVCLAFHGKVQASRTVHPSGIWVAAFICIQFIARLVMLIPGAWDARMWRRDLAVSLAGLFISIYLPILACAG